MFSSPRSRRALLALVAATAVAGAVAPPAPAAAAAPVVAVGPNRNVSQAVGNQFEPAVAIDPSNPLRMFELGRDETGSLIGARSGDGGATWTHSKMGTSIGSADHLPPSWGNTSVTFDDFGNLFVVYLGPIPQTWTTFAMSTDGGATFSHQLALANVTDQPVVATGAGSVWVTYNRGGVNYALGAAVTGLGTMGAFGVAQAIPGANDGAFGDIAVGPNGEVMVAFGPHLATTGVLVSVDPDGLGPATFSSATAAAVTNVPGFNYIPAVPSWGIDSEAHLAWDHSPGGHHGRVSLLYLDAPLSDLAATDVYVVHSDDNGATWSAPTKVDDDTGVASQFMPGFAIDQTNGALAASWYDTAGDATRTTAQYRGAVSTDGGATWTPSFAISAGTSDQAPATPTTTRDTDYGDYTGLAFHAGVLLPAWGDNSNSTGDNPAGTLTTFDLYTAVVNVTYPTTEPPSVTTQPAPTSVVVGTTYSFTAASGGLPAPTVQWQRSDDGGSTFADVAGATAGTYTATAAITDGGAQFRAVFTNDAGQATSDPAALTVTTTTTVSLVSRIAAPAFGQKTAITASVASPTTGTKPVAAGTVDLYDGPNLLATAPVKGGRAHFTPRAFDAGIHALRAAYSGSGAVLPGITTLALTIAPAATTVVVTGPTAAKAGRTVTLHVTVKTLGPAKGAATGTLTIDDNGTPLPAPTLDTKGRSALIVGPLTPGPHTITVTYPGDANHAGATSAHTITVP